MKLNCSPFDQQDFEVNNSPSQENLVPKPTFFLCYFQIFNVEFCEAA